MTVYIISIYKHPLRDPFSVTPDVGQIEAILDIGIFTVNFSFVHIHQFPDIFDPLTL